MYINSVYNVYGCDELVEGIHTFYGVCYNHFRGVAVIAIEGGQSICYKCSYEFYLSDFSNRIRQAIINHVDLLLCEGVAVKCIGSIEDKQFSQLSDDSIKISW